MKSSASAQTSRIFGKVRQLGYVVHDIEAAMRDWSQHVGVGPFFYNPKVEMRGYRYRGVAHEIEVSIALANSGDVQIELIQQRNDAPSLYLDRLREKGEVLHHVSAWSSDYDTDLARIAGAGHAPVQEGWIGPNRFAYFVVGTLAPTTIFEIYDIAGRPERVFERVRRAAEAWDGTEPVRPLE